MTLIIDSGYTQWDPASITTALWLDASDESTVSTSSSLVTEWRDKSGNTRHVAQSDNALRPSYVSANLNGKNVIGTTVVGKQLINSSAALLQNVTGASIFAVASCTSTTAALKPYVLIATSANNTRFAFFKTSDQYLQTGGRRVTADVFASVSGSVDIGTGYNILGTVCNYSTTTLTAFRNGSQDAQRTDWLTSGSTPSDGGAVSIFNSPSGDLPFFTGNMGEIVVLNSVASTDTRQRIEGYLGHKWGLTANLPSDHPYKINAPAP